MRAIRALLLALTSTVLAGVPFAALAQQALDSAVDGPADFEMRVVAADFANPWELTLAPDGMLWVTERSGGKITRLDPASGNKTVLAKIAEVASVGGQDGLLGMALKTGPDGKVTDAFVAYTYLDFSRPTRTDVADPSSPYSHMYMKVARLHYNAAAGRLADRTDVLVGLPASTDHNSGRLKLGPDGDLYLTIGDGGHNQFANVCLPIEAQRLPTTDEVANANYVAYQGKSLRISPDGSVPPDNPVIGGVRSHVFTYGHRNMQGIDFGPDGTLYASEQGPKTDDEVNILTPGGNYGWPHVAGHRDDNAYRYADWHAAPDCKSLQFSDLIVPPSVPQQNESDWAEDFVPPLATLFTVPSGWNFADQACHGTDFICWPTVAASSIEYQPGSSGGAAALLVTTLKNGSIYRVPLAADGKTREGKIERLFHTQNRYRDTAISADGRTLYVATDNGGMLQALAGGATDKGDNPGAILAFTLPGS